MPEAEGVLRIEGFRSFSVEDAREFLRELENCYDSLYAFEAIIDDYLELRFAKRYPFFPFEPWKFDSIPAHDLVAPGERLAIDRVKIESPGFWDFLGKLNPLEVIRLYLNDRHERRKDREYRESAEAERLRLENKLRETELLKKQVDLLKEVGATKAELTFLKNRLIYTPLEGLGRVQDKNLIDTAKIIRNEPSGRT